MTTKNKIILGMAGAAALGAIIGILIAPEKGSDLREKIKTKGEDWASELGKWFDYGKEQLNNLKTHLESDDQQKSNDVQSI